MNYRMKFKYTSDSSIYIRYFGYIEDLINYYNEYKLEIVKIEIVR